jgi:hypothetical protein
MDKLQWYKEDNVENVDHLSINGQIVLRKNVGYVMIKITLLNNVFIQETEKYNKREIWARIMETNLDSNFNE